MADAMVATLVMRGAGVVPGLRHMRWLFLAAHALRLCSAAVCSTTFSHQADLATSIGVVRALEYIPAPDELLVAGGEDQRLRVWTLSPLSLAPSNVIYGHQETIWSLEWIAEYSVLAAGSGDGTIRFWPINVLLGSENTCIGQWRTELANPLNSNDGSCMGSEGQHVVSWRDAHMEKRHQVHSLVWAASIATLVSGWSDTRIRTWTWVSGTVVPDNPWRYTGYVQSQDRVYDMVWLSSAQLLATASPDQRHPRLWDGLWNNQLTLNETVATNFSFTGTFTYLTEELGAHSGNGKGDCPYAHCDAVLALAADTAGGILASGSMDNSVILWNITAGAPGDTDRMSQISGHGDYVTSIAWLDSETKIATGSKDNKIRIWSVADAFTDQNTTTGDFETLERHSGAVNALEWITNASTAGGDSIGRIVSGGSDGSVMIWTCW